MDSEKIMGAVVGGIIAGFSIGVGFMIAQKTIGRWVNNKAKAENDTVASAVKDGVKEGVKEAKAAEAAANFSAMVANNNGRRPQSRQAQSFMGFDGGKPRKIMFESNPFNFVKSPNSNLNTF